MLNVRLLNFQLSWMVNKCQRKPCRRLKMNTWLGLSSVFANIPTGTSHQPAGNLCATATTTCCKWEVYRKLSSSLWQRSTSVPKAECGWRMEKAAGLLVGAAAFVSRRSKLWFPAALVHLREAFQSQSQNNLTSLLLPTQDFTAFYFPKTEE